jgi:uncharacterized protein
MADHTALVRQGFDAFANGDIATLQELFSPDIVWHGAGTSPVSGDYKGGNEVFALFGKILEDTQGTFSQDIHAITEGDDHVVAITHATATRNGKTLDDNQVLVFHIDDNDKVTEVWITPWDQAGANEFWS